MNYLSIRIINVNKYILHESKRFDMYIKYNYTIAVDK